jgi:hypothetical protein
MEPKINVVPGFIMKLWKMVNDPNCDDLISWSDNGQSFIIIDPAKFSQELSKYFKHNNLSSFIRQLNMYGFRKVATIENTGLNPNNDDLHFYHPEFIRGHKDRLENIKRKLPQKIAETVDLKNVYQGISEIDERQKDVSKTLADLRRENEMLWQELHDLRQKHQQQQLYISRLMKLVYEAMEQNGIKANMLQLRHNPPLMIEGGAGSEATVESPQTLVDPSSRSTPVTGETTPTPTPATTTVGATEQGDTLGTPNPSALEDPDFFFSQAIPTLSETEPLDATFQQSLQTPNSHLQSQVEAAEFQIDNLVPTISSDYSNEDLIYSLTDTN